MAKVLIQDALRQGRQKLVNAGFIQKPASEITLTDRLYDGWRADLTMAVQVVDIKLWRNRSVYIVCQRHDGNKIGFTHDATELLWIAPRKKQEA